MIKLVHTAKFKHGRSDVIRVVQDLMATVGLCAILWLVLIYFSAMPDSILPIGSL